MIKANPELKLSKVMVSEAGASVYSASEYAAAEFPDIVKRLEAVIAEWEQQLVEPMWPAGRSTLDVVDGQTIQLYF